MDVNNVDNRDNPNSAYNKQAWWLSNPDKGSHLDNLNNRGG